MFRKNKSSRKSIKKNIIIFSFCVLIAFILFKGVVNYGVDLLSHIVFPIQKKVYTIGNLIRESKEAVTNYKTILNENRVLKNEHVKYDILVATNKELTQENDRLREILDMKAHKKLNIKVAEVNFRNPNNLYERFYINQGARDGVTKDMIVLSGESLLGKVGKVYEDYSVVDMITAENFNVSSITDSKMLGIIKGSDEGDGTLYFEANTFQNSIEVGESVYTSGISEIYPKGLYIGKISEIDEDEGEIFRSIKVKNDIDILNLHEVLLLVPEEQKESHEKN